MHEARPVTVSGKPPAFTWDAYAYPEWLAPRIRENAETAKGRVVAGRERDGEREIRKRRGRGERGGERGGQTRLREGDS